MRSSPAVEQAGSIAHLTRWVLREAVARCAAWRNQGVMLGIAVNISVDDLTDEYLPYFLLELTQKHQLAPHTLTLEVTESAIMHNVQKSLAVVNCIHELGFRLAIDDFGTGHSALSQLKRLPVDELKIDKSFVTRNDDAKDDAILRATIDLAHQLGLTVVAEGVEDDAAIARLDGARLRARARLRHRQADAAGAIPRVARAAAQRRPRKRRRAAEAGGTGRRPLVARLSRPVRVVRAMQRRAPRSLRHRSRARLCARRTRSTRRARAARRR